MKNILLTLAAGVMAVAAWANDVSCIFTYVGDDPIVQYGTRRNEKYDLAMKMNNPALEGKRITKIRVLVNSPAQEITDCSVWLTSELLLEKDENNKKVNVPNILSQPATLSEDGWIEATLDEPYTLTQAPVYVGYSFTNTYNEEERGPIAYSQTRHADGFYIHTSMTVIKWKDYEEELKGVLPIYVTVEGDFSGEQLALGDIATDYPYIQADITSELPFNLYNMGDSEISSLDYSYEINGIRGENHIDFATPLTPDIVNPYVVKFPIGAVHELGEFPLTITIDKVNGVDNALLRTSATYPVEVHRLVPVHRTVLEEGTGSWCSACTRGAAALNELNRLYPENFIGLAYHVEDIMETMEDFPVDFPHYPSAYINRTSLVDPYYGNDKSQHDDFAIEALIVADFSIPAIAAIDVESEWGDESMSSIEATANVAFTQDVANHEYRVSFLLIANGLTGEGAAWNQSNSIAARNPEDLHPVLRPLADAGNPIEDFVFNDVVIISKEIYGVEGSLPTNMSACEWYDTEYTFNLSDAVSVIYPDVNLVQDKDNLEVVALLIDSNSGAIVNAAKAHVGKRSAINRPTATTAKVIDTTYYDMQGRVVVDPVQGIYIAVDRLDDGSVRSRKLLVKRP